MTRPKGRNPFVEKLRARDAAAWEHVEAKVIPKVLRALGRMFGQGRRWHDLEGFVRSAQRTACRRLDEKADAKLESLESFEDFEKWLVIVARNKFAMAHRRAQVEDKHQDGVARDRARRAPALDDEVATEIVRRLAANLHDEDDRAVFHGKLTGKDEAAIAVRLGCSIRKIGGIWKRVRARLMREAQRSGEME